MSRTKVTRCGDGQGTKDGERMGVKEGVMRNCKAMSCNIASNQPTILKMPARQ